ncbi:MAG: GNAT family N-acetyltransferase [Rhodobacteraceae bacterium]|nr:GNAT family N-acetyltransferase [Paracoccaceae bacterium]MBL4558073.1 GNAT family N-acetyltransferase [Paracoccaceae bacterium]HBG98938.1 hypothetical protein [Paracoccaceae bacterium]
MGASIPLAVATAHKGKGIGRQLIAHGLDALRQEGVGRSGVLSARGVQERL